MKLQFGNVVLAALALFAMAACGGDTSISGNQTGGPVIVTISGTVSYEFVPPNAACSGLDFGSTQVRRIRGATVQILNAGTGALMGSVTAGTNGEYSFANVPSNTTVQLRVRAELKQAGAPGWDVEIRDNFIAGASDFDIPAPPPFSTRALYVLDGSNFNSGTSAITRDLVAATGWVGNSYTAERAAAPFAILDSVYTAMQFVLASDPNAVFPPLDVFWSANNTTTVVGDITAGELGTSFYDSGLAGLFLLGDASDDTEEFDDHVIVHEWGHFFEDKLSRADSFGGPHFIGESLEARLAFGEGWASALAGIALDEPVYCDTGAAGTLEGFSVDAESGVYGIRGWFNEWSVTSLIYDLWDTNADAGDIGSIGFAPIYNVMTGPQAVTEAFTTIFSFAADLRNLLDAADQAILDARLDAENIGSGPGLDIWATNETNDAGIAPSTDVLPPYTDYTADGTVINICVNNQLDGLNRDGNNAGEDRYLRIAVPITDEYDVIIATNPLPPDDPLDMNDESDPDIWIFDSGIEVINSRSGENNLESFTTPVLQQGTTYVAFLEEWTFEDSLAPATFPGRICFDVSFTPTP